MAGIYDAFNASLAGNGQGPQSPQVTTGAPGYNPGSWGNQPPNLAGGLRAWAQGMPGGSGVPPNMPVPPPIAGVPGGVGMFGGGGPAGPPQMGTGGMLQSGTVTAPGMPPSVPTAASPFVAGQSGPMTPDAAGNTGMPRPNAPLPQNMAGAMRPFLGG